MCMAVFFPEKIRLLPFSLLIANPPIGRHGPWWRIADLRSLGNVPSWKRAPSGPRGAGSAAASSSGAGTGGATSTASPMLILDCSRKFRLRPLWWFRKSSGFYGCRPRHCPVDASSLVCLQHRRHTGGDVYPTDSSQWSWTRHNLKLTTLTHFTTDNSESIKTQSTVTAAVQGPAYQAM